MGSAKSKSAHEHVQLVSPGRKLVVFDERFTMNAETTLSMQRFGALETTGFKLIDTQSSDQKQHLQAEGVNLSFSNPKRKIVDFYGKVVGYLCYEKFLFGWSRLHASVMVNEEDENPLFQIGFNWNLLHEKVKATIKNKMTGQNVDLVYLAKHFKRRECLIYLGDPSAGGIPIARLIAPSQRPIVFGYDLTVAPGVDLAAIFALCVFVGEAVEHFRSTT
jgi:hypothetical protein